MAALKILVVVMGLLIVAGTAVLAYMIVRKVSAPATNVAHNLVLPEGARLAGIANAGNQLLLQVSGPGDEQRLLLVDPSSWQITGTVTVETTK